MILRRRNWIFISLSAIFLMFLTGFKYGVRSGQGKKFTDTIPRNAQKLIAAYPNFIKGYADNYILLKDGTKMLWDDGIKNKSPQQLLDKPDLEDMFAQHYAKDELKADPPKNFDPGRIRNEAFFLKMYGNSETEVRKNLTEIVWCPKLVNQKITVTSI